MNVWPRKCPQDGGGSHRRSRAASTQGLDARRDEDMSDARPLAREAGCGEGTHCPYSAGGRA